MELEVKVTDNVRFGFPARETTSAMRMYRSVAELVESVGLADVIDPKKALLIVKEIGNGDYEVRPEGCKIANYSKRPFTEGPLREERYCNEMGDRVVLVRKGPISNHTRVTIFFEQKS